MTRKTVFFLLLSVTIDNRSKPSEVKSKLNGSIGICFYFHLEYRRATEPVPWACSEKHLCTLARTGMWRREEW